MSASSAPLSTPEGPGPGSGSGAPNLPRGVPKGGHTMTTVELFPADSYNQKTIQQGHPPGWTNRAGGDYDLVVLGGGPAGPPPSTTRS